MFSLIILTLLLVALSQPTPPAPGALRLDFHTDSSGHKILSIFDRVRAALPKLGVSKAVHAGPNPVIMDIENRDALYVAQLKIGTPSQKVNVQIDTGLSDLWVPSSSKEGEEDKLHLSASSSFQTVNFGFPFHITYSDRSSAKGIWAQDTVSFGDSTVLNTIFGYADTTDVDQGVLGIGLPAAEAITQKNNNTFLYANLPFKLKAARLIKKAAYLLYLNLEGLKGGSILFGALDKAKYEGELEMLPIEKRNILGFPTETETAFFVNVSKIGDSQTTFMDRTLPALLDSGTTLTYAPFDVVNAIGHKYGKYNRIMSGYMVSCSLKGDPIEFTFKDTTIKVPIENFLYRLSRILDVYDDDQCLIGIVAGERNLIVLGENFLRAAYVLYDLEDNQCGIAQAKYTHETDIQVLPAANRA